ncbi:MAG: cache domain-containing protein [Anaerolineae bacterium]|nr:cache domain-containing protein [Anaerolineae bacterium]
MRLIPNRFISIRTKIILPFLLLAIALATVAGYMAWQIATDSIHERFINQLIEVGKLANKSMVRQEDRMLETIRLLANIESVPQAIKNNDAEQLRDLALPVAVNSQEEAVIFLNIEGVSILSMYHQTGGLIEEYNFTQGDDQMRLWNTVQLVIQNKSDQRGDKFAGYYETSLGNYFYIIGPVRDENQSLVGAILIGRSIDKLVKDLREETLAQITLYNTMGEPLSTTFIETPSIGPLTAIKIIIEGVDETLVREIVVTDIHYNEILGTWIARDEILGVLGASFSQNFIVILGRSTWLRVFTLVVVSSLLVIAIGIFISNVISRPIRRLEKAISLISEGNLDIKVDSSGRDEVARLAAEFNSMVDRIHASREELMSAYESTIEGWAKTLEARDHETLGHSHRVVSLTIKLSKTLGISEEDLIHVRRGAFLHDIGKLIIPDSILQKPGPLTKDEWKIVHAHPKAAFDFLKDIDFLEKAINIPYCHHENWDGSGYPRGLKGAEIPIEARIFTVVDVYDAIRSERPYKQARSAEEAFKVLRKGRGTLYDPQVVDTFLQIMRVNGDEKQD